MTKNDILVSVQTCDRKDTVEVCLTNLSKYCENLVIYDDFSNQYDKRWLSKFSNRIIVNKSRVGYAVTNLSVLIDFYSKKLGDYNYLYMTNDDALHDPSFIQRLIDINGVYKKSPISLFNRTQNKGDPEHGIFFKSTSYGISLCLSRAQVRNCLRKLIDNSLHDGPWDSKISRVNGKVAISGISYVDHYAKDGCHWTENNTGVKAMIKTKYLNKRYKIYKEKSCNIKYLLNKI